MQKASDPAQISGGEPSYDISFALSRHYRLAPLRYTTPLPPLCPSKRYQDVFLLFIFVSLYYKTCRIVSPRNTYFPLIYVYSKPPFVRGVRIFTSAFPIHYTLTVTLQFLYVLGRCFYEEPLGNTYYLTLTWDMTGLSVTSPLTALSCSDFYGVLCQHHMVLCRRVSRAAG